MLLDKALKDYRYLFTPDRLWVMDRNYPGVPGIKALLETGTHVLIRVRDGITLRRAGTSWPTAPTWRDLRRLDHADRPVIEYTVTVAGRDAPELFCLITDLHDHDAFPARPARAGLSLAVDRVETCLKEAKSAIRSAGPSTGPMLRCLLAGPGRPGTRSWVTAVELARATARAAAAVATPARRGRRAGQPVHPRRSRPPPPAGPSSPRSGPARRRHLPAALTAANRDAILAGLARRRVAGRPGTGTATAAKARPGLPRRRAAPGHPHRAGRDERLPAPDRLTPGSTRQPVSGRRPDDNPAPRLALHSPYNPAGSQGSQTHHATPPTTLKSTALPTTCTLHLGMAAYLCKCRAQWHATSARNACEAAHNPLPRKRLIPLPTW